VVITNVENECRLDTAFKRDLIRDQRSLARRYTRFMAQRFAKGHSLASLAEGTEEQIFAISVAWPGHLGPTLRRRRYAV